MSKTKKSPKIKANKLTSSTHLNFKRTCVSVKKTRVKTWKITLLVFLSGSFLASLALIASYGANISSQSAYDPQKKKIMLETIKKKGCIFDGILNNFDGDDDDESIEMLKRSQCQYVHRAVETWLTPPDFSRIEKNIAKINRPDLIYSMFLAEAINPRAVYYYPQEQRYFNFSAMCRPNSFGFWGENTCQADMSSSEYRLYLKYITQKAMDLGIEAFLFGQVNFQDKQYFSGYSKKILREMWKYASQKNRTIVVGAQTGPIDDKEYLSLFDYIEGGTGLYEDGETIDSGPCYAPWRKGGRCWPMLWHKKYSEKAKSVVIHLDWSGVFYDDMSKFARMDQERRLKTAFNLYQHFTSRDMGFLLPFTAVLYENNGGCFGRKPNFYSASRNYSCADEDSFNAILRGISGLYDARFISQSVPTSMRSGENYMVSVTFENSGLWSWKSEKGIKLGSQSPRDNNWWGGRIELEEGEEIKPGQTKTFVFFVRAPVQPETYNFQWRMIQEPSGWFGHYSDNEKIKVESGI